MFQHETFFKATITLIIKIRHYLIQARQAIAHREQMKTYSTCKCQNETGLTNTFNVFMFKYVSAL